MSEDRNCFEKVFDAVLVGLCLVVGLCAVAFPPPPFPEGNPVGLNLLVRIFETGIRLFGMVLLMGMWSYCKKE